MPAPGPIEAPAAARRPGPWEGRGGGPYVDRDEVGTPPVRPPGAGPEPYDPPVGVRLTEVALASAPVVAAVVVGGAVVVDHAGGIDAGGCP